MRAKQQGFTLVELMVTVAIVAILARFAFLSYSQYVTKGNRAAAQATLIDIAQHEQQYLLDARQFAPDLTTLGYATAVPTDVSKYYTVSITNVAATNTPPTFTVQAVPITGTVQASDSAGTLSIDQSGNKLPASAW